MVYGEARLGHARRSLVPVDGRFVAGSSASGQNDPTTFWPFYFEKGNKTKQGVENWIEEWGDHEHTESGSARHFEGGNGACHNAWDRLCRGACRRPAG